MPVEITFTTRLIAKSFKEIMAEAENGPRSCLVFEYLDDLAPLLSLDAAIECFRHVLSQTTLKPQIIDGVLPLWLHGWSMRDGRMEAAALAPLSSEGISWRWPALDETCSRFRKYDDLPETWRHFIAPEEQTRWKSSIRRARTMILARTIRATIMNRYTATQHSPDMSSFFWRNGVGFHSPGAADLMIAEEHRGQLVICDWRTYPPYFPGDETSVGAHRPPRERPPQP